MRYTARDGAIYMIYIIYEYVITRLRDLYNTTTKTLAHQTKNVYAICTTHTHKGTRFIHIYIYVLKKFYADSIILDFPISKKKKKKNSTKNILRDPFFDYFKHKSPFFWRARHWRAFVFVFSSVD
eukprot:GEMP01039347.1.p1 GENE.GEMP01039347.1~~GEMP01039347.1.p1  ORF type:complete len:125 (-),score=4.87 GEMP01039347.1:417-791(-)